MLVMRSNTNPFFTTAAMGSITAVSMATKLVVQTTSTTDVGTHMAVVDFCRYLFPTVCSPVEFAVTIMDGSETCTENPTGL